MWPENKVDAVSETYSALKSGCFISFKVIAKPHAINNTKIGQDETPSVSFDVKF